MFLLCKFETLVWNVNVMHWLLSCFVLIVIYQNRLYKYLNNMCVCDLKTAAIRLNVRFKFWFRWLVIIRLKCVSMTLFPLSSIDLFRIAKNFPITNLTNAQFTHRLDLLKSLWRATMHVRIVTVVIHFKWINGDARVKSRFCHMPFHLY